MALLLRFLRFLNQDIVAARTEQHMTLISCELGLALSWTCCPRLIEQACPAVQMVQTGRHRGAGEMQSMADEPRFVSFKGGQIHKAIRYKGPNKWFIF